MSRMTKLLGALFCCGLAVLVMARPGLAQNSDSANVLNAQLQQMRSELDFLRRQVDASSGTGDAFAALVGRVETLQGQLSDLEARVSRLVELDGAKSRKIELLEQRVVDLEGTVIDLAQSGQTRTVVISQTPVGESGGLQPTFQTPGAQAAPLPRPSRQPQDVPTQVVTNPVSTTAIMVGALLNPGPVVPIVYRDDQGQISRPIPLRRPVQDLDPQPLSEADFVPSVSSNDPGEGALSSDAATVGQGQDMAVASATRDVQPATATSPAIAPSAGGDSAVIQAAYNVAYGYIERDDLASAETAFTQFLRQYPNDPLASNASYWLGESFYGRGMWNDSVRAFATSVREYRDGRKAPDSLLKLGITLGVLGQTSEACRLLSFLPTEYENASASLRARADAESRKLNCS